MLLQSTPSQRGGCTAVFIAVHTTSIGMFFGVKKHNLYYYLLFINMCHCDCELHRVRKATVIDCELYSGWFVYNFAFCCFCFALFVFVCLCCLFGLFVLFACLMCLNANVLVIKSPPVFKHHAYKNLVQWRAMRARLSEDFQMALVILVDETSTAPCAEVFRTIAQVPANMEFRHI